MIRSEHLKEKHYKLFPQKQLLLKKPRTLRVIVIVWIKSSCGVRGKGRVQFSKRRFHIHIYTLKLYYIRISILY